MYTPLKLLAALVMVTLSGYTVARASFDEYLVTTEIGEPTDMSGAEVLIGSNVDDLTDGTNPIGFNFDLDGTTYSTYTVSTNGWLTLGTYTTNSDYTNGYNSGDVFPKINGFWDDIRTHADAGYVRSLLEGSPGNRRLTIEWRTSWWSVTNTGPWVWQVRLYEGTNTVEFIYLSMIDNYSTSATIGMATSTSNYITLRPGNPQPQISTSGGGIHNVNIQVTPIEERRLYRFRRVLDDIACDGITFNAGNAAGGYVANSAVQVTTSFTNIGINAKNNIPIQFDVYRGSTGTKVYSSERATINLGGRFGTASHTFNPIPGSVNSSAGIYTVVAYPTNPIDEDYSNDTCEVPYFVLGQHDIIGFSMLQPYENVPPLFTKYPVGSGVPIEARFLNAGLNTETNVPIGYEIYREGSTTPIFSGTSVLQGNFASASFRDVLFPYWTPSEPGRYCIRVFSNLATDENRTNDTLPGRNRTFCFTAAYEIELSAIQGGATANNPTYPLGRPIPIEGLFENNGLTDATNSPATVYIYDPSGREVYRQTVQIPEITADGGRTLQTFPNFVPQASSGPGRYCVGIKVRNAADPVAGNDSISFCFRVLSPLSGDLYVGVGERFQTI